MQTEPGSGPGQEQRVWFCKPASVGTGTGGWLWPGGLGLPPHSRWAGLHFTLMPSQLSRRCEAQHLHNAMGTDVSLRFCYVSFSSGRGLLWICLSIPENPMCSYKIALKIWPKKGRFGCLHVVLRFENADKVPPDSAGRLA